MKYVTFVSLCLSWSMEYQIVVRDLSDVLMDVFHTEGRAIA